MQEGDKLPSLGFIKKSSESVFIEGQGHIRSLGQDSPHEEVSDPVRRPFKALPQPPLPHHVPECLRYRPCERLFDLIRVLNHLSSHRVRRGHGVEIVTGSDAWLSSRNVISMRLVCKGYLSSQRHNVGGGKENTHIPPLELPAHEQGRYACERPSVIRHRSVTSDERYLPPTLGCLTPTCPCTTTQHASGMHA